jgi:hypothetical protein
LEDLDAEVEINSAWEMIGENIKISAKESIGYYELKNHKPWFDQACSELVDQRKQAKLQWLRDLSETNGNYQKMQDMKPADISEIERGKYLKDKINGLTMNSKNTDLEATER